MGARGSTHAAWNDLALRAERLPDGGLKGIYVSLVEGETGSFAVTIDASGRELTIWYRLLAEFWGMFEPGVGRTRTALWMRPPGLL